MADEELFYVLVCVEISVDKVFGNSYSLEPVGVFNDLDIAINYATKLEELDKPQSLRPKVLSKQRKKKKLWLVKKEEQREISLKEKQKL